MSPSPKVVFAAALAFALSLGLAAPVYAGETGELTRAPSLVQFVEAELPADQAGLTGAVVLAVTIDAEGRVEAVTVAESGGEILDAAAVRAAQQFVFSPAEIDGQPSRIQILYRYEFVERVVAPTTASFAGVVLERGTRAPLAGVRVALSDGREVITDAEGRFELSGVTPGKVSVTLDGEGLTALSTEEELIAGERLEAIYSVSLQDPEEEGEGDDLEIFVSAPSLRREAVSTEISAADARVVPGTQGDVLRVVESLPGVARASLGTGALVVWGAAPEDTGVYLDGVPLPRLYHDGGLRSVVGGELVDAVSLVPGGYGASYGRGLGGLVTVRTRPPAEELGATVAVDLYDAAASVQSPLGERAALSVNARSSHVGPLLSAFAPEVEDYFPVPRYRDGQARLSLALGPNQTLDLTGLASTDETRRSAPNPDPARAAAEERSVSFERLSLRYQHDLGDGAAVTALVFGGRDRSDQRAEYGAVSTQVREEAWLGGVRLSYRARVSAELTLESGLDALVERSDVLRAGSVAVPTREGDLRVFGQAPPDQINSDQYQVTTLNVAPYVEADLALWDGAMHVIPGVRIDPYARSVSRAFPQEGISPTHGLFEADLLVEPRLTLRADPTETLSLTAALGRYGQQPQVADLSASFGTPSLTAATGEHLVLGVGLRPVETVTLDVTGFATRTQGLAMRSEVSQPARAEALAASGRGRTVGAQVMLRLNQQEGLYGWMSYTLARSERQDAPELDWRPSDYDQRHVLTALVGTKLPGAVEVGLRGRVATGYPRSEVLGATYDSRRDLYHPQFGEHNGVRLPTFFQLDLRVGRTFTIAETSLELSLEVQNLTNRQNVEELIYSADYTEQGAIVGLPILPVLGLRWSL